MSARSEFEGTFCLVLHSHLPWLAHQGSWPVGEEWLYQAWAHSYLPVVDLLRRFAAEGRRDVLTLGVTPVLAAQLDDPYCLRSFHDWLGHWQMRALHASTLWRADPMLRELAAAEHQAAIRATEEFETRWRHGFSPVLRSFVDASVVELLGGPLTHPFQPLLDPRVRSFALRTGLDDTALRVGHRPEGIWAPECGYAPGMEDGYAAAGVRRFLVDGPSLRGDTSAARTVGSSDVVCFGRDLEVTYRVWSPKDGYPGHSTYRDFHTWAHEVGLKPSRVTGHKIAPPDKAPYEPSLAADTLRLHVKDFVDTVVTRLRSLRARHGRESLVVAAYDTELFGHWWHEGPAWLEGVLRALPEAGVRVTTLRGALEAGHLGAPADLPASSWGSGKDWRVWDGEKVADIVEANTALQQRLIDLVLEQGVFTRPEAATAVTSNGNHPPEAAARGRTRFSSGRRSDTDSPKETALAPLPRAVLDSAVSEAMLALSSDWAFMVTKDSAADYARRRAKGHTERFDRVAALLREGGPLRPEARDYVGRLLAEDNPFGHVDARGLNP